MTRFFQTANSGAHKDIFWDILIKFQLKWFHYIISEYRCLGLSEVILAWVQSFYFLPVYEYSKKCFSDFGNTQLSSLSKCLSKCPSRVVCNICKIKESILSLLIKYFQEGSKKEWMIGWLRRKIYKVRKWFFFLFEDIFFFRNLNL